MYENLLCKERKNLVKYRGNDDFYLIINNIIDSWYYIVLYINGNNLYMYF